jgi:hypothetical protein
VAAHEELMLLARRRAELDGLEAPALLRAWRAGVHRHLGLGSFAEYVERLFGYSRRTLDDKLRTAEALEELPELTRSLSEGVVSWSAVRELARVATPETECEWLDAATGRTVHEVERLVSGRKRGERPSDEIEASDQRHTLRFDVSAETFAIFREAMRALRQRSNGPLDDDTALLLMAREILGGPTDEGRSSYQVALNVCERCGRGTQDARGEVIPVDGFIVEMARCDAQYVGRTPSQRIHVGEKGDTHLAANDTAADTHVGAADAEVHPDEPTRATQTIPPALRRKVIRRDHGRCVVPGCLHATFVDLHHIEARADGGTHDEDNLIVLCSAHHRALHHGQLEITGRVSQGRGLRSLGFGEREARRAIERVRSSGDTETLLRRAIALLTERVVRRE